MVTSSRSAVCPEEDGVEESSLFVEDELDEACAAFREESELVCAAAPA